MLSRTLQQRLAAALFCSILGMPLAVRASSQLANDMGCYNCHGAYPRGGAPSFEQLAARFAARRGDAAAQQRLADKFRTGELLEHVDAHERISPETALLLIRWLAEGAK